MAITGPVVPKQYENPNLSAPTPDVNDAGVCGELITCTKTGRMWVKWLTNSQSAMLPIRPEWSFSNLLGETKSGIRQILVGSAPFQGSGVELYGGAVFINTEAGVPAPLTAGTTNVTSLTATGFSVSNVNYSFGYNGGDTQWAAAKPVFTTLGHTPADGVSSILWFGVNNGGQWTEWGYQPQTSPGVWGGWQPIAYFTTSKCDFKKVVEANSGVKIPSIANAYRLETDASGNITTSPNPDLFGFMNGQVNMPTANTDVELSDLRFTIGLAGVTTRWLLTFTVNTNHNNNHTTTFKVRNRTDGVDVVGSAYTSNGYGTGSVSTVVTIVGAKAFWFYVQSTGAGATVMDFTSTNVPSTSITATRLA
jgi:hypothetical protein